MSKTDKVRLHLSLGKTITALEAMSLYSVFRLASIVHNLRRQGYNIVTHTKYDMNGTEYAEYVLVARKSRAA
jgi:hypothetical protein